MPRRAASSMRFTHSTSRWVCWRSCRAKISPRRRQEASTTTMTASACPLCKKRPGHFLLRRIRRQRIGPRQIHQPEPLPRLRKIPLCPLHGLAGPVARGRAPPVRGGKRGVFPPWGFRQRHGICMLHHASPFPKDRPLYAAHLRRVREGADGPQERTKSPPAAGFCDDGEDTGAGNAPPDTKGGSPMGCRLSLSRKVRTSRQRGGRVCAGNPGRVSCTMMIPIFQNFLKF